MFKDGIWFLKDCRKQKCSLESKKALNKQGKVSSALRTLLNFQGSPVLEMSKKFLVKVFHYCWFFPTSQFPPHGLWNEGVVRLKPETP